jgi:hypothetical protein
MANLCIVLPDHMNAMLMHVVLVIAQSYREQMEGLTKLTL